MVPFYWNLTWIPISKYRFFVNDKERKQYKVHICFPNCADLYAPLSPKVSWFIQGNGELWKKDEDGSPPNMITILRPDYFK